MSRKPERCKSTVYESGMMMGRRCAHPVMKDGYCHIHHPKAAAARSARSSARWDAARKLAAQYEERRKMETVVAWLEKVAPTSGLTARAKAELAALASTGVTAVPDSGVPSSGGGGTT